MENNGYIQHKKNDILSMLRIYYHDQSLTPYDIIIKMTRPLEHIVSFNNARLWSYQYDHNYKYINFSVLENKYIDELYTTIERAYKEYCDYENQAVKKHLEEIAKNTPIIKPAR